MHRATSDIYDHKKIQHGGKPSDDNFDLAELQEVINHQTPGRDATRDELLKWMNKESLSILPKMCNNTFKSKTCYFSLNQANSVQN
jgi:hypothetical protein